jgi:hypothetical protein
VSLQKTTFDQFFFIKPESCFYKRRLFIFTKDVFDQIFFKIKTESCLYKRRLLIKFFKIRLKSVFTKDVFEQIFFKTFSLHLNFWVLKITSHLSLLLETRKYSKGSIMHLVQRVFVRNLDNR